MGKWMNKSIDPPDVPETMEHLAVEDLARLADGAVEEADRQRMIWHLNRCQRCYEILQDTLTDLSAESFLQPASVPWWRTKVTLALAASIILVLVIGGSFSIKHWMQPPPAILATLDLDQTLKDILLEDRDLRWDQKERVNRLLTALQQKGLAVKELNLVILSKPYYQKKSLFGPREILHIRIEDNVAYLEVKEMDN